MLLKLLDSTVKTTHRSKHLIMLLFVAIALHQSLIPVLLDLSDGRLVCRYDLLVVSQGLLKLATGCNSLQSQSFFTFNFIC
jgi:hypothetical protein